MVMVLAQGRTITSSRGVNLRQVLLEGIDLHNGGAKLINCGIDTCAIEREGVSVTLRDMRRSLPLHSPTRNLRLACQAQVLGVKVRTLGIWGQGSQAVWTPEGYVGEKSL